MPAAGHARVSHRAAPASAFGAGTIADAAANVISP